MRTPDEILIDLSQKKLNDIFVDVRKEVEDLNARFIGSIVKYPRTLCGRYSGRPSIIQQFMCDHTGTLYVRMIPIHKRTGNEISKYAKESLRYHRVSDVDFSSVGGNE